MAGSPFKLLEPYSYQEKDIFFGRESEIYALFHLLKQTRLVLVYGSSGTGKTSLIQAGLPKVFKISEWLRIPIRRKNNINSSLRDTLNSLNKNTNTDLKTSIQTIHQQRWMPIYLVFDQFEEIFTLGTEEERIQFFTTLQEVIRDRLPCKVILSMREEYIGHLYEYEYLVPKLFDKRFRVESMKDGTIREVIQKMTASKGIILKDGRKTTTLILNQIKMGKQAAYLPYLQIYLHYLYEHAISKGKDPIIFDEEGVMAVGQLGDVLKDFIDNKINAAQQHLLAFGATPNFASILLDEFATSEGTKQSQISASLAKRLKVSDSLIQEALNYFDTQAKILKVDESEVDRYEPVHDVVAKQIHELRSEESKEYKAFERKLELDYDRWVKDKYAVARLLPELDLNKVVIFKDRLQTKDTFKNNYQPFITSSIRHHQSVKRRKYVLNIFLWFLTITALLGGVLAYNNKLKADKALSDLQAKTEEAQIEQAEKVLIEVNNITSRSEKIKDQYPETAKHMLKDALDKLETYPNNEKLKEQADLLKDKLEDR